MNTSITNQEMSSKPSQGAKDDLQAKPRRIPSLTPSEMMKNTKSPRNLLSSSPSLPLLFFFSSPLNHTAREKQKGCQMPSSNHMVTPQKPIITLFPPPLTC
ncbi:hypothetical protein Dimus_038695 [Dionaea muscipula]